MLVRFGSYSRGDMLQWKVRRRHWYSGDFGDKQLPVNECYVMEMMLRKRCVGGKIGIVMTADQILTELLSRRHIAFPILCSTACTPLSNGIKVTKSIEVDE